MTSSNHQLEMDLVIDGYKAEIAAWKLAFETAESQAKESVQSEMAKLRAENSVLKEEIARLGRLRHAARAYAESLPDVF